MAKIKFIQIVGVGDKLHGLTADGRVYKYSPEKKREGERPRFAMWSLLTDYTPRDPDDART